MIKRVKNEDLKYTKLPKEEMESRGILGLLKGPFTDSNNETRNGRKYSNKLWQKVFDSDLIKEQFENTGIFGELNHPTDREEVDLNQVAVVMPEPPVMDENNQLIGTWHILNTPSGKILKALCDYGCKLGVSTRGTGDLIEGPDGEEVDPDTYQLNAVDVVLIPAVKTARLDYVTESLNIKKGLKQVLKESLNNASDEERVIMNKTLDNLGIKLSEELEDNDLEIKPDDESVVNKEPVEQNLSKVAESELANLIIDEKEAIEGYDKAIDNLSATGEISDKAENVLKHISEEELEHVEELSKVVAGKEDEIITEAANEDIVDKMHDIMHNGEDKEAIEKEAKAQGMSDEEVEHAWEEASKKNESVENSSDIDKDKEVVYDKSDKELVAEFQEALLKIKQLEEENLALKEKLSVCNAKEVDLEENLAHYKKATIVLSDSVKEVQVLKEDINKKNKSISTNTDRVNKLVESVKTLENKLEDSKELANKYQEQVRCLTENLDNVSKQLDSSKNLVEKYRKSYKALKESYLEVKATNYGLKKEDVLLKLNESYKIKDIDSVCEELTKYKRNMNKLPFNITESTQIRVTKQNEYIKGATNENTDDVVSDSLLRMINLK